MEQLVMRWANDGSPAVMPQVPEGLGLTALPEMKDGVEQWLDVVSTAFPRADRDGNTMTP